MHVQIYVLYSRIHPRILRDFWLLCEGKHHVGSYIYVCACPTACDWHAIMRTHKQLSDPLMVAEKNNTQNVFAIAHVLLGYFLFVYNRDVYTGPGLFFAETEHEHEDKEVRILTCLFVCVCVRARVFTNIQTCVFVCLRTYRHAYTSRACAWIPKANAPHSKKTAWP